MPADHRRALRNKANQLWHADSTYKRVPALGSVLSARIIPSQGGETEFVSTRLAWERLEPATRKRIENSFAWHDYTYSRGKIAPNLVGPRERAALPPQCWRMVWTNPVNGRKALYVASHTYAIEGMEQAAAQELLAELIDAASAPGCYRLVCGGRSSTAARISRSSSLSTRYRIVLCSSKSTTGWRLTPATPSR